MDDPAPPSRWAAKRPGQKALYVWLPAELIQRVHERRRAEGRTLKSFVERTLLQTVEMAEQYAATAGPHRRRRGRAGG